MTPDRQPHVLVGLLLALAGGIAWLYGSVLVALWGDWLHDPNYEHGVLVIPAAAWLLWRRRSEFAAAHRRPSTVGALIVALSLGLFVLGTAAFEFFLTRLSLVGVLAGIVVQLFGWRQLRASVLPLTLLALAIPLPSLVFNQIAFPMQLVASRFGVGLIEVLGIPVVREGNVILLQRATLEVAEACSGVRSLISLSTLALFYGAVGQQPPASRTMVLISVFPVVIVANGLRVAGSGVVAHAWGQEAASGFLHDFSGWLFFGSAILMLFAVERAAAALPWAGSSGPRGTMRTA